MYIVQNPSFRSNAGNTNICQNPPFRNSAKNAYIVHATTRPTQMFKGRIRPLLMIAPGVPSGIPLSRWCAPV